MIPTSPVGILIYTCFYALICFAIFLRVFLFDRRGGAHNPLFAWLAWLICVGAGSVPIRLLVGGLPVPDPISVMFAALLLAVLLKTRGSVYHLLPRRQPSATANTASARDLCQRYLP